MSNMATDEKSPSAVDETNGATTPKRKLLDEEKDTTIASSIDSSPPFSSPYDWSLTRKVSIALTVSLGQLVQLMSASMMAPALPIIGRDLHLSSTGLQVSFSIYLLGLGIGPFLLAPASEVFGRKPVWIFSSTFYILWNSLCPVGKTKGMMIAARILSGVGASVGTTLAGPIAADMFTKENRGKSLAIAYLFPYLGPALGPIVGGVVSEKVSWPWLFWVLSIFDAVVVLAGILIIRESYQPVLQRRHERRLAGQKREPFMSVYPQLLSKSRKALAVPVRLLFRRPLILIMSMLNGLSFGIYILWLSTYATLFIDQYHESAIESSLHYISIALGAWIAAQGGGQLVDFIFKRLKARHPDQEAVPEYRLPMMLAGAMLAPIGLFWAGWSAQSQIHWIMIDIGSSVYTIGSFAESQAISAYILDEFGKYGASANAAYRLPSYAFGFAFPLFAPDLWSALGYGWGASLLALVWIGLALPIILSLWVYGPKLRGLGRREDD